MPAEQTKNQTTDMAQDGGASGTKTTSLTPRESSGTPPLGNGTDGQDNNEKGNRNVKVGG